MTHMGLHHRLARMEHAIGVAQDAVCMRHPEIAHIGPEPLGDGLHATDESLLPPPSICAHCGVPRMRVLMVEADPGVPFTPHRWPAGAG